MAEVTSPLQSFAQNEIKTNRSDVVETISKLQKDTLYVLNRTCKKRRISNEKLAVLFKVYYDFSEVRVLPDSVVYKVSKQNNVVHYAVVGNFPLHDHSPSYLGIFLLDSNSNPCRKPYPPHVLPLTSIYGKCIKSDRQCMSMIKDLNDMLHRVLDPNF